MASGERAASGAQLLFGGFCLTSALALPQENAASSSAPAAQRATAKNFLPQEIFEVREP